MPSWMLSCRNCSKVFAHSEVKRESLFDYFLLAQKPTFPPEGLSIECPHCHNTNFYKQADLTYAKSANQGDAVG